MPLFHIQFNWQQSNTRTGGWREGFWNDASSIDVAKTRAMELVRAFNNFKGEPVFCPSYRVSVYPSTRIVAAPKTGFTAKDVTASNEADYTSTKVQFQLTGTTGQKTTQWIGGVQDADTRGGGFWRPRAATTQAFNAIKAILLNVQNGWSINVLNVAFPKLVIVAINGATGQVTTSVNHGYNNDDYVRVQRVNGIDHINGIWQIAVVDGKNFTLIGWPTTTQVMTRSNARVQKQNHVPVVVNGVDIVQVTSHRVGRPTDLLGGRRKRPSKSLVGPLAVK